MKVVIPTTDPLYQVDGQTVTELVVTELGFRVFCELVEKNMVVNDEKASQRKLFRARAKVQVKATLFTKEVITLTDNLISKMPIPYALRLKDAINEAMLAPDDASKPEILGEGDGIAIAIHLKLGNPIKFGGDKPPITELEFRADVFEDLEEAILADSRVDQIVGLFKIAKPVDGPEGLIALPSWAFDQLSFEDGMFIANKILPNFTQGQQDS
jgi:hypothetical protein